MHHKVMIIDGRIVVTGSYNLTWSAERDNDENILVVEDPGVAAIYEGEFQRRWGRGLTP
jgi:phosphatidylserine/phosphatidylglycerophosphate/cardiolipin synthase-like enzyme